MYISGVKVSKEDGRKVILGTYYDEVQNKVNWAYNTAQDIWKRKYPKGEGNRREVFGADYELVQY